jgi:hypothetical protein
MFEYLYSEIASKENICEPVQVDENSHQFGYKTNLSAFEMKSGNYYQNIECHIPKKKERLHLIIESINYTGIIEQAKYNSDTNVVYCEDTNGRQFAFWASHNFSNAFTNSITLDTDGTFSVMVHFLLHMYKSKIQKGNNHHANSLSEFC